MLRRMKETQSEDMRQYYQRFLSQRPCSTCHGQRVRSEALAVKLAGKTIADPMEKSSYFPPMLVQIVNLGERSGRLDELLNQAAQTYQLGAYHNHAHIAIFPSELLDAVYLHGVG